MEVQDVNYVINYMYEPGKYVADPRDNLFGHMLPKTERDDSEPTINAIISNEHGVVMKAIKRQLQAIMEENNRK